MLLDIRPLTPEVWPALSALFDEGGDPKWCWCMYWRRRGIDFRTSTAASNREELHELVGSGPAPGLVAVGEDGSALGWVSLGPREDFERLEHSRIRARFDDVPVWSVVCFVVARRARRAGMAARLLDAAIAYAREHGAPALEGYPVDATTGKPTPATLYSGTLSTFRRAGFRDARTVASPQATVQRATVQRATVQRAIVRLDLTETPARD